MSKPFKHDPQWARAKELCRLNMEDIRMAKELGFSPKALMKNRYSPSQKWKAPVKEWIRDLYEERFGRRADPKKQAPRQPPSPPPNIIEDDIPF